MTRGANGCWTLRIEYSTNHYQEWDECPTKDALQETGGRTFQSFDSVAAKISDLNEFRRIPPGDTIRVKAQPDQQWRVSCDGRSTTRHHRNVGRHRHVRRTELGHDRQHARSRVPLPARAHAVREPDRH